MRKSRVSNLREHSVVRCCVCVVKEEIPVWLPVQSAVGILEKMAFADFPTTDCTHAATGQEFTGAEPELLVFAAALFVLLWPGVRYLICMVRTTYVCVECVPQSFSNGYMRKHHTIVQITYHDSRASRESYRRMMVWK